MLGRIIVFLFIAAAAPAQKLTPPADAKAQVDKVFARYQSRTSPGCAVGVGIGGSTVLRASYGMADLEHEVPLSAESVFEPGSVTKQFTAASVLLLVQQGKLSLDDPVRKYFPELADYGAPLTVRHLLNHTSGLRDWGEVAAIAGWPRTTRVHTHAHVLEILGMQKALNYTPGAEYSYTNSGYNLAAMLVERVSGKSLPEFSREQIFGPLDMSSTQWRDEFRRIVPNRAIAYTMSSGAPMMDMPFEDVFGNGGLLTTVGDLLRWNQNFTTHKVGGQAMFDAQHQRGVLNDGRTIAYAAGLMVLHYKGLNEVSHSGSTAGYSAWLGRYPDQGLNVAVLCNVTANATQFGHAVADVYLGDLAKAETASTAAPDPKHAGLYRSVRDHSTLVIGSDGRPSGGNRRIEFTEDGRLRILSEGDEGNWYENVERWTPTEDDLAPLAGEYRSDEAEVTFVVKFDGGHLTIHRRPNTVIALAPTYRDGFNAPGLGSVRFLRDASGRVTELSVGQSRVWELRCQRVK